MKFQKSLTLKIDILHFKHKVEVMKKKLTLIVVGLIAIEKVGGKYGLIQKQKQFIEMRHL